MKYWTDKLTYVPCDEALNWLKTQPDAQTAWDKSERGDWMLFHAGKLAGKPGGDERRPLVLAACACAHLALPYIKKGELRPLKAIETAERWARGEADAPSLEEVRQAAAAAYANAAHDANAAANAAAFAAAYAYGAAAYAAANANAANAAANAAAYANAATAAGARAKTLAACADIVRQYYPMVPK